MKDSRNIIVILFVALIAIIAIVIILISSTITNHLSDSFGLAIHPIYSNFSAPESGFTINGNTLSVSDYAIYKTGYYSINGANWQNFTLTGTILSGNWLNVNANANLPNFPTGESYIVIYSCSKNNGAWNCHDGTTGRWQLQIINNTASSQIIIYAAGRLGAGAYPTMDLLINNNRVASFNVTGDPLVPTYIAYNYTYAGLIDKNTLIRINYTNDLYGTTRDLRVDKIIIDGTTYESESPININTGIWDGVNCGGIPFPGNEWLNCSGYIQYNLSGELPPISCTSAYSSSCYNGSVYWYNSCGVREGIKTSCSSTQTCTNNVCVTTPAGTLVINGQTFTSGKIISVSTPTSLIFSNNLITGVESGGHGLVTNPGEATSAQNNYLDAATITGNKITFGVSSAEQEGFQVGFNVNDFIQYNYFDATQSTGAYAVVFKSGNPNMIYTSGGFAYNIVKNANIDVRIKGMNGVNIYGNTFYDDTHTTSSGMIYISANSDVANPAPSTGTKIKNNIFYSKNSLYMIVVYDIQSASDLQSDYNVFYCESGSPMFSYLGATKTYSQWQALGFDTHSIVINPNFIDKTNLVPSSNLNGTNLGTSWQNGLSANASWTIGTSPATSNQGTTWQVGARIKNTTCVSESDTVFCSRLSKSCGLVTANDNCGTSRTVTSCGTCSGSTPTCTNNVCTATSTPSTNASDIIVCISAGYNCGTKTISGTSRNCGSCPASLTCNSTSNICESSTGKTIYVSPSGSDSNGDGTSSKPYLSLNTAWSKLTANDMIYMRGGQYRYGQSDTRLYSKSGSANNMLEIWAYPGEKPIINYSGELFHKEMYALDVDNTNYLYLKGIRVTSLAQPTDGNLAMYGLRVNDGSSNCKFEQMETDHIGGWGVVIGQQGANSNNLFLNFDSHHNADPNTNSGSNPPYGWSDGFETASWYSTNNAFVGCRAWGNSDDGWDLLRSSGTYTLDNCWSFHNGYHEDGITPSKYGEGGEGYKLLGPDDPSAETSQMKKIIRNSLSFDNTNTGIAGNTGDSGYIQGIEMLNDIAYNNGNGGINVLWNNEVGIVKNVLCYKNVGNQYDFNSAVVTHDHNSFDSGITVTDADFVSLDSSCMDDPRKADGSLPDCDFLKLKAGSHLIDAGTNVGLPYNGNAPDIGAFETG